ncbi:Multiple epidermal growth factor-like domains protein 6 [Balamuthia mandrillaris]
MKRTASCLFVALCLLWLCGGKCNGQHIDPSLYRECTDQDFIAAKECFQFCDYLKFVDATLYRQCIETTITPCLDCYPNATYSRHLPAFVQECTLLVGSVCYQVEDMGSLSDLWTFYDFCGEGWYHSTRGGGLCICSPGWGGPQCDLERSSNNCKHTFYEGGCVSLVDELGCTFSECDRESGVCTTNELRDLICPSVVSNTNNSTEDDCFSLGCIINDESCYKSGPQGGVITDIVCSDGKCVAIASDCDALAPSVVTSLSRSFEPDRTESLDVPFLSVENGEFVGTVQVRAGSFMNVTTVSVSSTSFVKLKGYLNESFNWERLMSSVVTLTASSKEGQELLPTDFLQPVLVSFRPTKEVNLTEVCIAFLNETRGEWQCLPQTAIANQYPQVFAAETPHFTDFTLLLTGTPNEEEEDGGEDNDNMVPVIAGVVGSVCIVVLLFATALALAWFVRREKRRKGHKGAVNFVGEDGL